MRLLLVVIFVFVVGGSLGIAHTWTEFSRVQERMELPATVQVEAGGTIAGAATSQRPADTTGQPQAKIVGESSHDFGVLARDASSHHSFVVSNDGDADLLLEKQNVSCGLCVQTTFTTATLKPGEEITIPVTLRARKPGPELNENLELRTNDNAHAVIRFDLIAYVSEAAGASVSELALGTISTDKGGDAGFRVYGFTEQPLEILKCTLDDPGSQDYFEWEFAELTQEVVKAGQAHAKSGQAISVHIKPGLPVGPLQQSFTIVARAGELVTINLPVTGRVTGDLSLVGGTSKFAPDKSLLSLGRILASEGASAKLLLMVKGEHRDEVQVTVGECEPDDYLSATVGERRSLRNGETYLYPVTIEIPQNLSPLNRLGGVGSSYGKIVLQTTHPTAKEVTLYVRFAVE